MHKEIFENITFIYDSFVLEDLKRNLNENIEHYRRQSKKDVHMFFDIDYLFISRFIYNVFNLSEVVQPREIKIRNDFFDVYFRNVAVSIDIVEESDTFVSAIPIIEFDKQNLELFNENILGIS